MCNVFWNVSALTICSFEMFPHFGETHVEVLEVIAESGGVLKVF